MHTSRGRATPGPGPLERPVPLLLGTGWGQVGLRGLLGLPRWLKPSPGRRRGRTDEWRALDSERKVSLAALARRGRWGGAGDQPAPGALLMQLPPGFWKLPGCIEQPRLGLCSHRGCLEYSCFPCPCVGAKTSFREPGGAGLRERQVPSLGLESRTRCKPRTWLSSLVPPVLSLAPSPPHFSPLSLLLLLLTIYPRTGHDAEETVRPGADPGSAHPLCDPGRVTALSEPLSPSL